MSVQIVPSTLHSGSLDQLNDLRGLEGCGTHFLIAALSCSVWEAVGPPDIMGAEEVLEASAVGAAPSSPSRPPQKLLEGATTWRPGHNQNVEISARLSRCQSRFVSILPFCILQEHSENSWRVFRIEECNICYFHYFYWMVLHSNYCKQVNYYYHIFSDYPTFSNQVFKTEVRNQCFN